MDKRICYAGAIPVDLDWQEPQRNTELALGYLMQAAFGTSTLVDGLAVTQQGSPNMTVQVGTGAIITYTTVDPTGVAYGAMTLNTSNLVKIGINATSVNMSALTAPAVAGQSQNWLIEAKFLEADGSAVVLPYYNAANPSLPYTGPANAGTSQNTRRTNTVSLQWKGGTAATTGSQVTPTPDSGWVGIAVVTVANGQATITNSNIAPYVATPVVPTKLPNLRQKLTANLTLYVSPTGSDSKSGLASWDAFATLQKAWSTIVSSYDLNGFVVTVSMANGTYTAGLVAQGSPVGATLGPASVVFSGNPGSPTSCIVSVSASNCFSAANGAAFTVTGVQMIATGTGTNGCGIICTGNASVAVGAVNFGACGNSHILTQGGALITGSTAYTISGSAPVHWNASAATLAITGITVTLSGSPVFSVGFAQVVLCGVMSIYSNTFSGSTGASSPRYLGNTTGVFNTGGTTATTYLPGTVNGSLFNQALYT